MYTLAVKHVRWLCLVLFLATIASVQPTFAEPLAQTTSAWTGQYFSNPNLQGNPLLTRPDPTIDFNWANGPPDLNLPADNFSVRWVRWMSIDIAGDWAFTIVSDNGARLYIDDALVLDGWSDGPTTARSITLALTETFHLVRVEYYSRVGNAEVHLYVTSPSFPDWRGEYYGNPNLTGTPALVRNDNSINFNFGTAGPGKGMAGTNFSARWTRAQYFNGGKYRLTSRTDDGARVWVDGQLLIDQWHDAVPTNYSADVALAAGTHFIRMDYYQKTGGALAQLSWIPLAATGENWRGEYFDNPSLAGTPALVREETDLSFNWGTTPPVSNITRTDNWSARWTARRTAASVGYYTISATVDDGARVWVDSNLIIDQWHDSEPTTYSATIYLNAGLHDWRVEFYEHSGSAQLRLQILPGVISPSSAPISDVVVDDGAPGFFNGGIPSEWRESTSGYGNRALSIPNGSFAQSQSNWARWYPVLARPGYYEVSVYVPGGVATTRKAPYVIAHAGAYDFESVNQAIYVNQWVALGKFYFDAAGNEYVALSDNTYESSGAAVIVIDAVRFKSVSSGQ